MSNDINQQLLDKVKEQDEFIKGLAAAANVYGLVVANDGDFQVVASGTSGELRRVTKSKACIGQAVVIASETGQVLEVADIELGVATARVVGEISSTLLEIDSPEGSKIIRKAATVKEVKKGDRVVLDGTKLVALQVLPEPPPPKRDFERVAWDDIAGCTLAKMELREMITILRGSNKLMEAYGLRVPRGFLLSGPPGNGKTLLGKAVATEIEGNFLYVSGTEILSMWVGASEEKIRDLFSQAKDNLVRTGQQTVIFIDEADAVLSRRGTGVSTDMEKTIVPTFLTEMDGLEKSAAIVILATNRPDTLDPAVVREGRIDKKIHIAPPTDGEAVDVLTIGLRKAPLADTLGVLTKAAVEEMKALQLRLSGAALINATQTARQLAARRDMEAGSKAPSGIIKEDLCEAIRRVQ